MLQFRNRKIAGAEKNALKIEGRHILLFILVGIGVLITLISMIFGFRLFAPNPRIESVSEILVSPGETIELTGRYFGNNDDYGKILLDARSIPRESIEKWSKRSIKIKAPDFEKSAFLYIETKDGKSDGILIINREHFPQLSAQAFLPGRPYISYIEPINPKVGELVTITGMNFREAPFFPGVLVSKIKNYELPFGEEPDYSKMSSIDSSFYQVFSDRKIIFSLPEDAETGSLVVVTGKGLSNPYNIEVDHSAGRFQLSESRNYTFKQRVELYNIGALPLNSLYLWLPKPIDSVRQSFSQVVESSLPSKKERGSLSLVQLEELKSGISLSVERKLSVIVNNLEVDINPEEVLPYKENSKKYIENTSFTELIPSNLDIIRYEVFSATKGYTSPYAKSRVIYAYLSKKFSLIPSGEKISMEEMYRRGEADEKSFVLLSCALLRAAGIPTRPVFGVRVGSDGKCYNKQWIEIFYRGVGWVPSDIISEIADAKENGGFVQYNYFGRIGNDHIAFSKGVIESFQVQPDGVALKKGPAYSLQSFTEERVGNLESYRSRWLDLILVSDN